MTRKLRYEFAAAQEPVLLAIEEHDHRRADAMLSNQARAFEADCDCAGVVVGAGRAGHGVVVRPKENERPVLRRVQRHHNIVVATLQRGHVAQAARVLQQEIPRLAIGGLLPGVMARKRQHLDQGAQSLG